MSPLTLQQKQDLIATWRSTGMTQVEFCATHTGISPRTLRSWVKETRRPDDGVAAAHAVITKAIEDLMAILGAIEAAAGNQEAAAPRHLDAPTTPAADLPSLAAAPMVLLPAEPTSLPVAEAAPAAAPPVPLAEEVASPAPGTPLRRARRGSFYDAAVAAMESADTAKEGQAQHPLPRPSLSADGPSESTSTPAPPGRLAVPSSWHFYL